jgi:hypothetical protein
MFRSPEINPFFTLFLHHLIFIVELTSLQESALVHRQLLIIFLLIEQNKDYSINPISNGFSDHDAQIIQLHDVDIPTQQIKPINKRVINEATIAQFKIA